MAATVSIGSYWTSKSQVDDLADLEAGVEQIVITNIGLTEMASTVKIVHVGTSQPSSPSSGQLWQDTSALSGAPSARLKRYVAEWRGVGGTYSATAPSTTDVGERWYDMGQELWRTYRDATDDLHGIAGWHPEDVAFQLWKNVNAGTVDKGDPVVNISTTTNVREMNTTTVPKDHSVVGVANETINTGQYGVVAMVSGGAYVDVYVGDTATAEAAKGDLLITSATAGEARTVGPRPVNPRLSAISRVTGLPAGAFAEATEATAGDGLVQCKLLGQVGGGAMQIITREQIAALSNLSVNNAYHVIDLTSPPDAGASVLADASHAPLIAVILDLELMGGRLSNNSAQDCNVQLRLSPDGSTETHFVNVRGRSIGDGTDTKHAQNPHGLFVQTSNESLDGFGERFQYKMTETEESFTDADIYVAGYIY